MRRKRKRMQNLFDLFPLTGEVYPPGTTGRQGQSVRSYRDLGAATLANADTLTNALRLFLLERGIYVHNRYVLRCAISAAHDEHDIDLTAECIEEFLRDHHDELEAA